MINQSGLRYLPEGSKGSGGTRLSIRPYVIHSVYEKRNKDPNLVYSFLREGPVIKDRYSFPPTTRASIINTEDVNEIQQPLPN